METAGEQKGASRRTWSQMLVTQLWTGGGGEEGAAGTAKPATAMGPVKLIT